MKDRNSNLERSIGRAIEPAYRNITGSQRDFNSARDIRKIAREAVRIAQLRAHRAFDKETCNNAFDHAIEILTNYQE